MVTPTIETPRLLLRGWKNRDVEPWVQMNADPRVMEFFPAPYSREDSEPRVAVMQETLEKLGYGWWAAALRSNDEFAGVIVLQDVSFKAAFTPAREVGWCFRVEMWGQGYATEGSAGALGFAHDTLGWQKIVAFTSALNLRSQRVMQRLEMTHDPNEDFDHPNIEAGHPLRRHVLYRKTLAA